MLWWAVFACKGSWRCLGRLSEVAVVGSAGHRGWEQGCTGARAGPTNRPKGRGEQAQHFLLSVAFCYFVGFCWLQITPKIKCLGFAFSYHGCYWRLHPLLTPTGFGNSFCTSSRYSQRPKLVVTLPQSIKREKNLSSRLQISPLARWPASQYPEWTEILPKGESLEGMPIVV